jgi:hypothetical protein
MSLGKRRIEEGWILCKMDALQCSINCPEIKRGSTDLFDDHDRGKSKRLMSVLDAINDRWGAGTLQ